MRVRVRGLRAMAMMLGSTGVLLGAAFHAGCEAVPDIRFVADDARSDVTMGTDAARVDSSDDVSTVDAGPCGPQPDPGATCCGKVWCVGCDPAKCTECEQKCSQGGLCCPTPGTVNCNKPKCN